MLAALVVAFGTLAAGGFFLVGTASADNTSQKASIIERIASRFNLDKDAVQGVFNEQSQAHQEEMTQRLETRLSEAVSKGTITEEQKSLILAKHEELQKEHETNLEARRNMTREERRADNQKHRDEMKAWAEANNIPSEFVGIGIGMRDGTHSGGERMGRFGK